MHIFMENQSLKSMSDLHTFMEGHMNENKNSEKVFTTNRESNSEIKAVILKSDRSEELLEQILHQSKLNNTHLKSIHGIAVFFLVLAILGILSAVFLFLSRLV